MKIEKHTSYKLWLEYSVDMEVLPGTVVQAIDKKRYRLGYPAGSVSLNKDQTKYQKMWAAKLLGEHEKEDLAVFEIDVVAVTKSEIEKTYFRKD